MLVLGRRRHMQGGSNGMDVGVDCMLEVGGGDTAGNDQQMDFQHNPLLGIVLG